MEDEFLARKNAKIKNEIKSESNMSNKETANTVSSGPGASATSPLPLSFRENEKEKSLAVHSREESQEEDSPMETQTESGSEVVVDANSVDMNMKNLETSHDKTISSAKKSLSLFLSIPPSPIFQKSSGVQDFQTSKWQCKDADEVSTLSFDRKHDDMTDKGDVQNQDLVTYIRATETSMPAIKCEVRA